MDDKGNPTQCTLLYPFTEDVSYPFWEAIPKGATQLLESLVLAKNEIQVRLGGGGGAAAEGPVFQGPVGIAAVTGDIINAAGWRSLIELAALLSLNLAIFNVLPIPMLDGGRILFVLVEIARGGRRIAPEKEALVHMAGFALLLSSVVIMTFFDIRRIVS